MFTAIIIIGLALTHTAAFLAGVKNAASAKDKIKAFSSRF